MFTTVSSLISRLPEFDDERAWQVFEERYSPLLKHYFMKSGCGGLVSVDLAQDTIHRAILGFRKGTYQPGLGRLRDWIGGIARNVLRNHWRAQAPERSGGDAVTTQFWADQEDPAAEAELADVVRRFDAVWVRARLSALVRLAAQVFDRRDLQCYFLVEIRKLPIKTVAKRTGLSERAVFQKRRKVANWFLAVGPRFVAQWES